MIEQILMGASAVVTLSACYVGFYYAKRAEQLQKMHDGMVEYANRALLDNIDLKRQRNQARDDSDHWMEEAARMADVIGKHQEKAHACDKCNQFASKRAAKTAELREYVASKAVQ